MSPFKGKGLKINKGNNYSLLKKEKSVLADFSYNLRIRNYR